MPHIKYGVSSRLKFIMVICFANSACTTSDSVIRKTETSFVTVPVVAPAPVSETMQAPPTPTAQLQSQKRICIHLKHHTNNYFAYSEVYAEAWVQDCDSGERVSAQLIEIGAQYRPRERYYYKSCANTSTCVFEERTYGYGVSFHCVMGRVRDATIGTGVVTYPEGYGGQECVK